MFYETCPHMRQYSDLVRLFFFIAFILVEKKDFYPTINIYVLDVIFRGFFVFF